MASFRGGRMSAARLIDRFYHACWFSFGLIFGLFLFVYIGSLIPSTSVKYSYDNPIRKDGPKLFCYIKTSLSKSLRAFNIWNTWARHCDGVIFGSSHQIAYNLPTHVFGHQKTYNNNGTIEWLWMKDALQEMDTRYRGYDWYLHAPDVAFVLVENLKKALRQFNSSQPIVFGSMMADHEYGLEYPSFWPGYAISKEALKKTVSRFPTSMACKARNLAADMILGRCLATAGVSVHNANNATDYRMIPFRLEDAVNGQYPAWLSTRFKDLPPAITSCCSPDYISSTYVRSMAQYEYYHLIYIVNRTRAI